MDSKHYTFKWPGLEANEVFVCGSFDGWSTRYPLNKRDDQGGFVATITLPCVDKIYYKFIVDNNWYISVADQIENDFSGFENNVIYLNDIYTEDDDKASEFTSISYPNSDHLKQLANVISSPNSISSSIEDLSSSIQITLKDTSSVFESIKSKPARENSLNKSIFNRFRSLF
ncbi:hypothetical protein DAMA08_031060 [Martiniozyma asiatica (nom. inval.)]|nr:hypothetical protein DAMA08_031060 [Martiniozyma asiatica]